MKPMQRPAGYVYLDNGRPILTGHKRKNVVVDLHKLVPMGKAAKVLGSMKSNIIEAQKPGCHRRQKVQMNLRSIVPTGKAAKLLGGGLQEHPDSEDHVAEAEILVLGLRKSGKSTLLSRLGRVETISPFVGFKYERVQANRLSFIAWTVGTKRKIKPIWRSPNDKTGVVFLLDASDRDNLEKAKDELYKFMYSDPTMRRLPHLILANKMDKEGAMSSKEIIQRLGLEEVHDRRWHCRGTSIKQNVAEGFGWLTSALDVSLGALGYSGSKKICYESSREFLALTELEEKCNEERARQRERRRAERKKEGRRRPRRRRGRGRSCEEKHREWKRSERKTQQRVGVRFERNQEYPFDGKDAEEEMSKSSDGMEKKTVKSRFARGYEIKAHNRECKRVDGRSESSDDTEHMEQKQKLMHDADSGESVAGALESIPSELDAAEMMEEPKKEDLFDKLFDRSDTVPGSIASGNSGRKESEKLDSSPFQSPAPRPALPSPEKSPHALSKQPPTEEPQGDSTCERVQDDREQIKSDAEGFGSRADGEEEAKLGDGHQAVDEDKGPMKKAIHAEDVENHVAENAENHIDAERDAMFSQLHAKMQQLIAEHQIEIAKLRAEVCRERKTHRHELEEEKQKLREDMERAFEEEKNKLSALIDQGQARRLGGGGRNEDDSSSNQVLTLITREDNGDDFPSPVAAFLMLSILIFPMAAIKLTLVILLTICLLVLCMGVPDGKAKRAKQRSIAGGRELSRQRV
uniref:Uncharacterized protein n=2 Tax=Lotharella globosa TaxID=91324 RepID=A0A7S3ZEB5_9EUKA|mmetsp:Transcript_6792/g.13330  ORF Transcript_6792/g.13330 Transcript_6792/m.13330 type:complete len:747 (+) Transcript_6792:204-2444(+)|eukprot:CAMPEP_0167829828 /NCGR_PEP_ID=MMETSP0112_2-20121227/12475_1 /TAXON_ID=91324 /ORGANISM="Lotharella globosa, Strain CCCM811" /LENGTH=746 /DNA_ID=CAMNT_0007733763 /DNA_START=154 /DNA_END=2394 /DNA_ORIENTATION=+